MDPILGVGSDVDHLAVLRGQESQAPLSTRARHDLNQSRPACTPRSPAVVSAHLSSNPWLSAHGEDPARRPYRWCRPSVQGRRWSAAVREAVGRNKRCLVQRVDVVRRGPGRVDALPPGGPSGADGSSNAAVPSRRSGGRAPRSPPRLSKVNASECEESFQSARGAYAVPCGSAAEQLVQAQAGGVPDHRAPSRNNQRLQEPVDVGVAFQQIPVEPAERGVLA